MRFHWSLPVGGLRGARSRETIDPLADLEAQRDFCRNAEDLGIDSVLVPIGFQRHDPITLASVFAADTKRLTFMVAARTGIVSPTYFVQQINTVAAVSNGRISINVVLGHSSSELRYYGDFLDHDERYQRTDEFWTICDALWRREFPVDFNGKFLRVEGARVNGEFLSPARSRPEVYFAGGSEMAADMAAKHGDCLLCLAAAPEDLAPRIEPALKRGVEVGIMCTQIGRPDREEAVRAAYSLAEAAGDEGKKVQQAWRRQSAESKGFARVYAASDAQPEAQWPTPYLWYGLVPYMGPPSVALVGGVDEITDALFEYRRIGVTQFIFQGRPDLEAMKFFGTRILPAIRRREQRSR